MQRVELAEDPGERRGGLLVDDELARVRAAVEAPVPDREQAEVRRGRRGSPCARLARQPGLDRRRHGLDHRVEREHRGAGRRAGAAGRSPPWSTRRRLPGERLTPLPGQASHARRLVMLRGTPKGPAHPHPPTTTGRARRPRRAGSDRRPGRRSSTVSEPASVLTSSRSFAASAWRIPIVGSEAGHVHTRPRRR